MYISDVQVYQRNTDNLQFGGSLLGTTFKEQSKRWEDIVMSHVSDAIILVHQFIVDLLKHVVTDKQVRDGLYDNVLLENLQASYKRATDRARFLLETERGGKPITYNHYFNSELRKNQIARINKEIDAQVLVHENGKKVFNVEAIKAGLTVDKSNPQQVREYLHDILQSYYEVSAKRFVDVVCQQVIDHFLLNGKGSPLHVFSTELVFDLNADTLDMIAGEDQVTKQERESLAREIDNLQAAMKVLRG